MQAMAEVEGNAFRTQEAQNLVQRDLSPLMEEVAKSRRQGSSAAAEDVNREDLFYRPPTGGDQMSTTQSLMTNSEDLLRESQA
jgi:hypothetical protein